MKVNRHQLYLFRVAIAVSSLLVLLFSGATRAQTPVPASPYTPGMSVYVFTASGLTQRSTPDIKGTAIQVIPYGTRVEVLADPAAPTPFINGNISGHWAKIRVGAKEGFAFDGYLSRLPPIEGKATIEDYFANQFKVKDTTSKAPEKELIEYKKTRYTNGIIVEFKLYEGGGSHTYTVPEAVMSVKELFLIVKVASPEYFTGDGKCTFAPDKISGDAESIMSIFKLEKHGNVITLVESQAD